MIKKYRQYYSISLFLLLAGIVFILSCYHGHGLSSEEQTGILKGRITYQGEWPDVTKEVRLIVLREYLGGVTDVKEATRLLLGEGMIVKISDPLPVFKEQYDYELDCPPGEHAWLVMAWFPDTGLYPMNVKELGAYYGENTIERGPMPIEAYANEVTDHLDIDADLSNVLNEFPFF